VSREGIEGVWDSATSTEKARLEQAGASWNKLEGVNV
jgi:hypothetical protein